MIDKRREILIHKDGGHYQLGFDFLGFPQEKKGDYKYLVSPYPNFTALFLNISDKSYKLAKELYNERIINHIEDTGNKYELKTDEGEPILYDFYEAVFVSVVFAYNSVEHLINSLIPNNVAIIKEKDNEKFEFESKNFIEKFFSLEEKFKILPKIFDYHLNLRKLSCWQHFKTLIKFRNEIVHLKSQEFNGMVNEQTKLISQYICDTLNDDIIESARKLIKYLKSKIKEVPGFPSEFMNEKMESRKYFKHYTSKKIEKEKNIKIVFKNIDELNKFMKDIDSENNIGYKIIIK